MRIACEMCFPVQTLFYEQDKINDGTMFLRVHKKLGAQEGPVMSRIGIHPKSEFQEGNLKSEYVYNSDLWFLLHLFDKIIGI